MTVLEVLQDVTNQLAGALSELQPADFKATRERAKQNVKAREEAHNTAQKDFSDLQSAQRSLQSRPKDDALHVLLAERLQQAKLHLEQCEKEKKDAELALKALEGEFYELETSHLMVSLMLGHLKERLPQEKPLVETRHALLCEQLTSYNAVLALLAEQLELLGAAPIDDAAHQFAIETVEKIRTEIDSTDNFIGTVRAVGPQIKEAQRQDKAPLWHQLMEDLEVLRKQWLKFGSSTQVIFWELRRQKDKCSSESHALCTETSEEAKARSDQVSATHILVEGVYKQLSALERSAYAVQSAMRGLNCQVGAIAYGSKRR